MLLRAPEQLWPASGVQRECPLTEGQMVTGPYSVLSSPEGPPNLSRARQDLPDLAGPKPNRSFLRSGPGDSWLRGCPCLRQASEREGKVGTPGVLEQGGKQ